MGMAKAAEAEIEQEMAEQEGQDKRETREANTLVVDCDSVQFPVGENFPPKSKP